MPPRVAVAMIVKNEEALLARCLESVKDADAIYIADTGSTDRTVEIARKYTDNVYLDYIWSDDFSDAQNHVLNKIRGKEEWIFSIDADEYCHDFKEVRKAIEIAEKHVRCFMYAEGGTRLAFCFSRLFRNDPEIFWCQPGHKHLNLPGEGEDIGNIEITFGWSPAHRNDPDRTLRILEKAVASEGADACRNLYYLGREYWYKGRYTECTETLSKYVEVSTWPAEKAEALCIMSRAFSTQGLDEEARVSCLLAININPNFKEAVQFMADISNAKNAKQWRRMARTADNNDVLWDRVETTPASDVIFLAPHNDDETLFGAYTLLRVKPLVIVATDSFIQPLRGDQGCGPEARRKETIAAMKILGCPVLFLGIPDNELTEEDLRERLKLLNVETLYIPAIQGGNEQHDLIGRVALDLFGRRAIERYTTYSKTEPYTVGNYELAPTPRERELKNLALDCYRSQIALPSTSIYFQAQRDKSEWLL